uniref:Uncharacterized protein LOC100183204 n=1 Tax=Phallusia mammillata TaxID=59560 RepID=A0A6F9DI07_9ASCI|nr:uncharacterized protein LOC100183204 [Phallusia mammillata]
MLLLAYGVLFLLFKCGSMQYTIQDKNADLEKCGETTCCYISLEKQPPPKVDDVSCYNGRGHSYTGKVNVTEHDRPCINWLKTPAADLPSRSKRRYDVGDHNYCRNPEPTENKGPWCYVSAQNYGYCDVLSCRSYPDVDYAEVISPPDCPSINQIIRFDVTFRFQNLTFYLTSQQESGAKSRQYMVYKFVDDTFTACSAPFVETLTSVWNLCLRDHDIITFATTSPQNQLYLYLQYPNIMLQLEKNAKTWQRVPPNVYADCVDPVRKGASHGPGKEVVIRSVFDFERVHVVFLEVKGQQYECQWNGGRLLLTSSQNAQFLACSGAPTSAHFIDRSNKSFAIPYYDPFGKNSFTTLGAFPVTNRSYVDNLNGLNRKPGLAAPILGYELFRNGTLAKLFPVKLFKKFDGKRIQNVCSSSGPRSRLFRVYFGEDFRTIVNWINVDVAKKRKVRLWIHLNNVFTKRHDFCKNYSGKCCQQYLKDFRLDRQAARGQTTTVGNEWTLCSLSFVLRTTEDTACPKLLCFHSNYIRTKSFALCEIDMGSKTQPTQFVSLYDMLGVEKDEAIKYIDADDASQKLSEIADSLRYPVAQNSLDLGSLVGSVEALQPVNYSQLSKSGTKKLIQDFVSIMDNLADADRADEWMEIQSSKTINATQRGKNVSNSNQNPHSLLFITENVLKQVIVSGGSDILESEPSFTVSSANVVSSIEKQYFHAELNVSNNNETQDKSLVVESSSANSSIPAYFITSTFPNIIHLISKAEGEDKNMQSNTSQHSNTNQLFIPNSPVLSVTVMQNGKKMLSSVKFKVPFNTSDIPNPILRGEKYYFTCSYLADTQQWDSHGCFVKNVDVENNQVTCSCNHTTNFAILLQVIPPQVGASDMAILSLISYIGESLSVFCLIITLVVFAAFRQSLKSERMVAHFHLVISLIIFHVVQLFSFKAENSKDVTPTPCIIVAFLTHFSLLAMFMWMLCEGITLHLCVIDVFNAMTKFKVVRYFIGWGVPLVVSTVTAAYGLSQKPYPTCYLKGIGEQSCDGDIKSENSLMDAQPGLQLIEWCWLSTENYLIWSLVLPAITVLTLNTVVLARVSFIIVRSSQATNKMYTPSTGKKESNLDHVRKSLKGAIILMPILGISWTFGLLPQSLSHISMLYLFTLMNATQGIFILLFHCILNGEVRSVVIRFFRKSNIIQHQNWSSNSNYRNPSVDLRQITTSKDSDDKSQLVNAACVQRSSSTNTSSTYFGGTSIIGNEISFTSSPEEHAFISTIEYPTQTGIDNISNHQLDSFRTSDMLLSDDDLETNFDDVASQKFTT